MRGQASTEFFLYLSVFMMVVISALVTVSYMQSSEVPLQKNRVAKETGDGFVSAISLAVRAGPGFTYKYYFPRTVYGYPYSMKLYEDHAIMEWTNEYGNFSYNFALPPFSYRYGDCLGDGELVSNDESCSNVLVLNHTNDDVLMISQER